MPPSERPDELEFAANKDVLARPFRDGNLNMRTIKYLLGQWHMLIPAVLLAFGLAFLAGAGRVWSTIYLEAVTWNERNLFTGGDGNSYYNMGLGTREPRNPAKIVGTVTG